MLQHALRAPLSRKDMHTKVFTISKPCQLLIQTPLTLLELRRKAHKLEPSEAVRIGLVAFFRIPSQSFDLEI